MDGAPEAVSKESTVYFQRGGAVTTKHDTAAFDYFLIAAENDHVQSQYEVGLCYLDGIGAAVNKEMGECWMRRASDNGNFKAMLRLLSGGFTIEPSERYRMCEKVAADGISDGQYELAVCFRDGIGVCEDSFTANIWFQRASNQVTFFFRYRQFYYNFFFFLIRGICWLQCI